jgi:hypothetical protein
LLVVHDLPTAAFGTFEVERTPRNEGSVVREIDEVDEGLAVNLGGAHGLSMPAIDILAILTAGPAEE